VDRLSRTRIKFSACWFSAYSRGRMTENSESKKRVVPREVIETALLVIVFFIAGLFWPPRDLLEEE